MPCPSFNIYGDFSGTLANLLIELMQYSDCGRIIRADYMVVIRADYFPKLRLIGRAAQVVNGNLTPGPLPENRRRMVGWDYLRLIVKRQLKITLHHATTPRRNPPLTSQSPQCHIAEGDDDVWLTHLDFTLEEFKAVTDDRQDELVPQHDVLRCDVGFSLSDEGSDVVARRTDADNIRDEAFRTHNPGFLEHLGELLPGETDERLTFGNFAFARDFTDNHNAGWAWTGWADLHCHSPLQLSPVCASVALARASSLATSALA